MSGCTIISQNCVVKQVVRNIWLAKSYCCDDMYMQVATTPVTRKRRRRRTDEFRLAARLASVIRRYDVITAGVVLAHFHHNQRRHDVTAVVAVLDDVAIVAQVYLLAVAFP